MERFLFGVEESCGYLIGSYVRDKDAIGAAMLICEMADCYKKQGKSLWDRLEELYQKYGYYKSVSKTETIDRIKAEEYMEKLREKLSKNELVDKNGSRVYQYEDYREEREDFPKSNVLKIWFENGSSLIIRPSGTEPKLKFYEEHVRGS